MNILIITDSGCTITEIECKSLNIVKLPLSITDGQGTFDDNEKFDIAKAVSDINSGKKSYKTSATPLGKIIQCIEENESKYDAIWFFPISKSLSSQYNQSKSLEGMYAKFKCFDIEDAGYGQEVIVIEAKKIASQGGDAALVEKFIAEHRKNTMSLFALNKVDGAVKSGRIGKLIVKLVNTIKIKFIIRFDGKLEKYSISSKMEAAIEKIINTIKKVMSLDTSKDEIVFYDGLLEKNLRDFALETITKVLKLNEIKFVKVPNIFTVHTLDNTFGMFVRKK
jgi:DegV family protein with EDD domain